MVHSAMAHSAILSCVRMRACIRVVDSMLGTQMNDLQISLQKTKEENGSLQADKLSLQVRFQILPLMEMAMSMRQVSLFTI